MNQLKKIGDKIPISLYWKFQFLGWGTVSLYWAYIVYSRDNYSLHFTLLNYVLDVALGITLTHLYRSFALSLKWNTLNLRQLALRVIVSIIILAVLFALLANLKWHFYWVLVKQQDYLLWRSLINWNPVLITGLRLMSIWILIYHLYHYSQKEMETAKKNAALSTIAKQAQLDNLSVQLNPHFLFNSLNSIKSLVIENPKIARRAIDILSDILRSSLYEKDAPLITIKNELELVKDYVELEKIRFEERLSVSINIEKGLEDYLILPLSIQLLVENAIKHGIDKSIDGGTVLLSITERVGSLQIIVQNPGKVFKNSMMKGIGIANLTKRLQLNYSDEACFKLDNDREGQVTATIIIPKQKI